MKETVKAALDILRENLAQGMKEAPATRLAYIIILEEFGKEEPPPIPEVAK